MKGESSNAYKKSKASTIEIIHRDIIINNKLNLAKNKKHKKGWPKERRRSIQRKNPSWI